MHESNSAGVFAWAAALLAGTVVVSCGSGPAGSELADGSTNGSTGGGSSEGEPECVTDADCHFSDYECIDGVCTYVPYCAPPGGLWEGEIREGPLSPYCSDWGDDFEESNDDPTGDGDPWACLVVEDCGPGQACLTGDCVTVPELPDCAGPILVEIPLPERDGLPVLDLAFVDFDADGLDELVLLQDSWLLIVDGDTLHEVTVPAMLDRHAVAQLDGDGVPDLLLGQSEAAVFAWVRGSPDAAPMSVEAIDLGQLSLGAMVGVDWTVGGTDEIVLTSTLVDGQPQLVTALESGTPSVTALDGVFGEHVAVGDLGGDSEPELVFARGCAAQVLAGGDVGVVFSDDLEASGCDFTPARVGVAPTSDSLLARVPGNGLDLVLRLPFDQPRQVHAVAGEHTRMARASMPGLSLEAVLLFDPDATWAWSSGDGTLDCHASAPELSGSVAIASGDVDGDGVAELASIDEIGVVHLWAGG